jgi:hypothetical protein
MKALTQRGDDARQIRKQTIKVVLNWGTSPSPAPIMAKQSTSGQPTTKREVQPVGKQQIILLVLPTGELVTSAFCQPSHLLIFVTATKSEGLPLLSPIGEGGKKLNSAQRLRVAVQLVGISAVLSSRVTKFNDGAAELVTVSHGELISPGG